MASHSDLFGCPIIESTETCLKASKPFGRGLIKRDYSIHPYGGYARAFTGNLIPENEWRDRILQRERDGMVISQLALAAGVQTLNQQRTNFCWFFAPAQAVMVARAIAGEKYVMLSPASGACLVTNYQNVGGWGTKAVKAIGDTGLVPAANWAPTAIDRGLDTPATRALREQNKLSDWIDLPARSFAHLMTMLLLGIPVPVGLNWWGHEVLAIDPILFPDGTFGARIWNSWDWSWGEKGFAILRRAQATPDDAIAPLVAYATAV